MKKEGPAEQEVAKDITATIAEMQKLKGLKGWKSAIVDEMTSLQRNNL